MKILLLGNTIILISIMTFLQATHGNWGYAPTIIYWSGIFVVLIGFLLPDKRGKGE